MLKSISNSLNELIRKIDTRELTLDAQQGSDFNMLIDLIMLGTLNTTDISTYDNSRIRGALKRLNLIDDFGDYYEIKQVAKILKRAPAEVKQSISSNRLLFIRMAGRYKIPSFQFDRNKLIPDLDKVIFTLFEQDLGFWASCLFLLNAQDDLALEGKAFTPLDAIKSGRIEHVLSLIEGI